jgi:hypothetical protein
MAQVVSRRPLTAEDRFRARVNPCGICGQSGTGTGFIRVLRFSPVISFHRRSPNSYHLGNVLIANVSMHPRLGTRPTPRLGKKKHVHYYSAAEPPRASENATLMFITRCQGYVELGLHASRIRQEHWDNLSAAVFSVCEPTRGIASHPYSGDIWIDTGRVEITSLECTSTYK